MLVPDFAQGCERGSSLCMLKKVGVLHMTWVSRACSMTAVLCKMAADQLLMAPLFLVIFFFATKTLEGNPHKLPGLYITCQSPGLYSASVST